MTNRKWHYVIAQLGHQGAGKELEIEVYVWVKDPIEALLKYRKVGGIKRKRFPDIFPLKQEESIELEKRILKEGFLLKDVKNKWYTTTQEYRER